MAKRMLIDAAHPEETRVVVTSGTRLEEFDFESSTKKQVKGNIYLAKVTRVEPSLQAAFVDYGGNRHGFLAFSEIHPDYYRIPVSDREREAAEIATGDEPAPLEDGGDEAGVPLAAALPEPVAVGGSVAAEDEAADGDEHRDGGREEPSDRDTAETDAPPPAEAGAAPVEASFFEAAWTRPEGPEGIDPGSAAEPGSATADGPEDDRDPGGPVPVSVTLADESAGEPATIALRTAEESLLAAAAGEFGEPMPDTAGEVGGALLEAGESESVETLGGDEVEEVEEADAERRRTHPMRHYKIQEVIKRRQIMLVQVAKEERGNKGAALTTYLSLAGRYCVLMPNTNRGGGVSRKITSIADRRRLKDILEELEIPEGMGVIVRTAGAERSKAEIKRDYEYLLRLWNEIRDLTLQSTAPALIYEEGNLIKRSIRDLYTRDIDEVLVEGEEGYKTAKAFMRTLMPSHAKRVQPYRDVESGLFHRFQIESQIDAIHSPVAQLRSGGYIVINQTEALVSIDVNSGRSTRERNIEETALRTNLEAADEIARQLRLRDLAGLIVIDFIDMEEHRNQAAIERRLKEALKNDRARIQVGRISPFGLLEMSRQRLRPSLAEASTQPCPHCGGTGLIRSVESTALYVLRSIEEEGIRRRSAEICIYVPTNVALYILNQKRESLSQIEARYGVRVMVARDDALIPPSFRLERLRPYGVGEAPPLRAVQAPSLMQEREEEEEEAEAPVETSEAAATAESEDERGRRRRRRRRPRRSEEAREPRPTAAAAAVEPVGAEVGDASEAERAAEAERRRRRRGRRGGRTRPRRDEPATAPGATPPLAAESIEIVPVAEEHRIYRDTEASPDLAPWAGNQGVETASLAPFAGDGAEAAPLHAERGQHGGEPSGVMAPVATAEGEEGIPFAGETERLLEEAAAVMTAPAQGDPVASAPVHPEGAHSDDEIRTVTEKPANPRRGWWQRLMQS